MLVTRSLAKISAQSGSTLIEVLVSIVILSIGLMGTAGLIKNSMRAIAEQSNAVGASNYARELGERMMGSPTIANRVTNNPFLFDTTVAWPTSSVDCKISFCNEADRAAWDLAEWSKRMQFAGSTGKGGIPGVKVKVCLDSLTANAGTASQWVCTPGANPLTVIKIAWASRDSTGVAENTTSTPIPRAIFIVSPGSKL